MHIYIFYVHQSNSSTCNTSCQTDISNKLKLGCYNFTINQVKHDEEYVFIYLLFDCGKPSMMMILYIFTLSVSE